MAEYTEERNVWPLMVTLQQCLEEENAKAGLPSLCFVGVLPGADTVMDYADGGQAWVRLTGAYPSTTLPAPDQRMATCTTPLAYTLEVGVLRCAPQVLESGEAPTLAQQFEWARMQMADMAMVHRAIACCMGRRWYVLGNYTPVGPQGNVMGGAWGLTIAAD